MGIPKNSKGIFRRYKMIHGLFLDPRVWKVDIQSSPLWNSEKYGIKLDLHPNAFNIPKMGIDKKYKFVLTTEVWEIPMRKTLEYLRKSGLKVFLMPRETFITDEKRDLLFKYPKFLYNGEYYFNPDVVVAPNAVYAGYWYGKTDVVVTGYPRFDYLSVKNKDNAQEVSKKYGLSLEKKIIFFPSYPPYYHKTDGSFIDLYDAREQTLLMMEEFAKNSDEYQAVVKVHPMSFKCFKKGTGFKNEVAGTLLKYYKNPTDYMGVIGDVRMSGDAAKDLLLISDVVVGFASTMLMEAVAVDKKVLHLLFNNAIDTNFMVYKDILPTAYTKEDAIEFLNNPYRVNGEKLVQNYLCGADGKSCERICNAIKNSYK